MSMMIDDGGEMLRQADVARALGSPFVAAVLEAGRRQLCRGPRTAGLIAHWPGDRAKAAMAMRFNGALHALARRGAVPALHSLYATGSGDFDGAIGEALAQEDAFVAAWMGSPPQTNEVGRAAAFMAALMLVARDTGLPFELLEIGSSAGLNLNMARYAYDLGGILAGDLASDVHIRPDWRGPPPPYASVEIVRARGVDMNPLDVADPATCERLLAFVWADQPARARRLERAIAIARTDPPRLDKADAARWITDRLAEPQPDGVCRVVFHSMVLQYLGNESRMRVAQALDTAGAAATDTRPLAWLAYEWNADRTEVRLDLTRWPTGERRTLATCHAYGSWINWAGDR